MSGVAPWALKAQYVWWYESPPPGLRGAKRKKHEREVREAGRGSWKRSPQPDGATDLKTGMRPARVTQMRTSSDGQRHLFVQWYIGRYLYGATMTFDGKRELEESGWTVDGKENGWGYDAKGKMRIDVKPAKKKENTVMESKMIPSWVMEMAVAPKAIDAGAMASATAVGEAADSLEEAIDEKITSGEADKRSIMSPGGVSYFMTFGAEFVGDVDAKALESELDRRYKAAGWRALTLRKRDGSVHVTLVSRLSDKDSADLAKIDAALAAKGKPKGSPTLESAGGDKRADAIYAKSLKVCKKQWDAANAALAGKAYDSDRVYEQADVILDAVERELGNGGFSPALLAKLREKIHDGLA